MDNIYEVVDTVCTEVKNDIACRQRADRIIKELSYLSDHYYTHPIEIRDLLRSFPPDSFPYSPFIHRVTSFSFLGLTLSVQMSISEGDEPEPYENTMALNSHHNIDLINKALKKFVDANYLRLEHIERSEILEAIPPISYGYYARRGEKYHLEEFIKVIIQWELV